MKKALAIIGIVLASGGALCYLLHGILVLYIVDRLDFTFMTFVKLYLVDPLSFCEAFGTKLGVILIGFATLLKEPKA